MIVYAGAIVVLFLFVIMFLGVDRQENIERRAAQGPAPAGPPARGHRPGRRPRPRPRRPLGRPGPNRWPARPAAGQHTNVYQLGQSVFTTYLFAFEATAGLLVIAVVGAVVLARRPLARRAEPEDGREELDRATGTRRVDRPRWRRRIRRADVGARRAPRSRRWAHMSLRRRLVPGAGRRALRHRRHRPAHPAQRAGHVHVHRADAQRRQPHLRHLRPHAARHRRPGRWCSSCSSWRRPRSWSASGSSWPSSAGGPATTADDFHS